MTAWLKLTLACTLTVASAFHGLPAHAAGMSTHAFMADFGRKALPEGPLKALLTAHRASLVSGAIHPDGGYGSGSAFPADRGMAEAAHWGDFTEAFMNYLRTEKDGGRCAKEARDYQSTYLADNPSAVINPLGLSQDCGRLIAFMFGNAAHGLTDESWDSLFEPQVRVRGEDPNPASLLGSKAVFKPFTPKEVLMPIIGEAGFKQLSDLFGMTPLNAIEYAGDIVGIAEHNLWAEIPALELPPSADLVKVYRGNRFVGNSVGEAAIQRAHLVARSAVAAERTGAAAEIVRIRNTMPWLHGNYFAGPGGVVDSGYMVAGMYEQWWQMLTAQADSDIFSPQIAGVYPKNGARNLPFNVKQDNFRIYAVMGRNVQPASV
ncbi:MAG TPA: hypothetical protein VFV39_06725, partial [Limnobacter sp.]|nr:hypothetical protein [Limnobacter sp.]